MCGSEVMCSKKLYTPWSVYRQFTVVVWVIVKRGYSDCFKRSLKCNNKVVVKMADKVVLLVNALVYVIVIVKYVVKDI